MMKVRHLVLQDRATAWMDTEIPLAPISIYEFSAHKGASGVWIYRGDGAPTRLIDVPVDFYLRELADLDIEDSGSVANFIDAWGAPVQHDRLSHRRVSSDVENLARAQHALPADVSMDDAREDAAIELGLLPEKAGGGLKARFDRMAEIRAAGLDEDEILARILNWGEVISALDSMLTMRHIASATPDDIDLPAYLSELNLGLRFFAPHVEIDGTRTPHPTILNVVAAQIANDIYSGAQLRVCRNETCRRTFTKQRGRADYGAYRTKGVLYCSKSCAKSQAQRELRRRRRKETGDA